MAERLPVLYNKKPCYDIVFTKSFDELWDELNNLGCEKRRICIVTFTCDLLSSLNVSLYAFRLLK